MNGRRSSVLLILGAVAAFALLLALEIATEQEAVAPADLFVDALAMALTIICAASAAALFVRAERDRAENAALRADLDAARTDGAAWRSAVAIHVSGLHEAIDAQFDAWEMSPAERDVALLILKGLSHKQIGALRATAEATVRQQAQAIYRKSGLAGKNALSAFFLEGLLGGPAQAAGKSTGNGASQAVSHR